MQWDIAGPETFLAITKSLYGGAVGIFIVYDTNDEVHIPPCIYCNGSTHTPSENLPGRWLPIVNHTGAKGVAG